MSYAFRFLDCAFRIMSYIFRFLATFVKKVVSCSNLMFSVSKKVQPTTPVSKNGLGLVFTSEKPLWIVILFYICFGQWLIQTTFASREPLNAILFPKITLKFFFLFFHNFFLKFCRKSLSENLKLNELFVEIFLEENSLWNCNSKF